MPALICAPDRQTLQPVVAALIPPSPAPPARDPPASNPPLPGSAALSLLVAGLAVSAPLGILLSDPELDRCDHARDYQCPDRQVVCGGRLRRGE
jgi:hypothetical protein